MERYFNFKIPHNDMTSVTFRYDDLSELLTETKWCFDGYEEKPMYIKEFHCVDFLSAYEQILTEVEYITNSRYAICIMLNLHILIIKKGEHQ